MRRLGQVDAAGRPYAAPLDKDNNSRALETPTVLQRWQMKVTITVFNFPFFCRHAFQIVVVIMLLGVRAASAQSCAVDGPRYNLTEDTVHWSMKIGSGRSCIRGIRFANVHIESVKLISPPQSGQIALQGSGFTYSAKANFVGGIGLF